MAASEGTTTGTTGDSRRGAATAATVLHGAAGGGCWRIKRTESCGQTTTTGTPTRKGRRQPPCRPLRPASYSTRQQAGKGAAVLAVRSGQTPLPDSGRQQTLRCWPTGLGPWLPSLGAERCGRRAGTPLLHLLLAKQWP